MRRLAYAMPLLALPLAAAACGGSKNGSATATLPDDPVAAVKAQRARRSTPEASTSRSPVASPRASRS